jgi:hypothetical protein
LYIGETVIRLILDIATMRVIYYTADLNQPLASADRTLVYDYQGDLPTGMTLSNSWNYRLIGNRLVNTETEPAKKPSLLESNRSEAQKLLVDRVNQARNRLMSNCNAGDWVRRLKIDDQVFIAELALAAGVSADQYRQEVLLTKTQREQELKNTEINRVYYRRLLRQAKTNEEIVALRDEFANVDLTVKQAK